MRFVLTAAALATAIGPSLAFYPGDCPSKHTLKYFFSFGSSWSDVGFKISSTTDPNNCTHNQPPSCDVVDGQYRIFGDYNKSSNTAQSNEGGPDPSYGGLNYLKFLANQTNVKTYDFAVGGTTVSNSCLGGGYGFDAQVSDFVKYNSASGTCKNLAYWTTNYPGNTSAVFVIFVGDNDILQGALNYGDINNKSNPNYATANSKLNCSVNTYKASLDKLYDNGARRFLYVTTPAQELSETVTENTTPGFNTTYRNWKSRYDGAIGKVWTKFTKAKTDATVYTYNLTALMLDIYRDPHGKDYVIDGSIDPAVKSASQNYYLGLCTSSTAHCIWHNTFHASWQFHGVWARNMTPLLNKFGYMD